MLNRVVKACLFASLVLVSLIARADFSQISAPKGEFNPALKIAIIGAGASGLTAAYTLKKLGYQNITVYEKEDRVGGKVHSYWYDGLPYELGAVWKVDRYQTIDEIAADFDIDSFVAETPNTFYQNQVYMNDQFIKTKFGLYAFSKSFYRLWRVQKIFKELSAPGIAGIHPDLKLPMKDFQVKYGIEAYTEALAPFITGCGYGYYDEVPAIYIMKLIPMTMSGALYAALKMSVPMYSFGSGWQHLWETVADHIGDVRLSSPVDKIERLNNNGETSFLISSKESVEKFDRVIVSTPLQHLSKMMELTKTQKRLFSKIKTYRYTVTLIEGENIPNASFADNIESSTMGHLNFALRAYSNRDVYVLYQLLPEGMTHERAMEIAYQDVEALGGKINKVILQKEWEYFPHVKTADLQAGFYEELESLQGVFGLYYIGGLMNFETVETTSQYAKALVIRYF